MEHQKAKEQTGITVKSRAQTAHKAVADALLALE
jgi:hypothetical protein